MRGVASGHDKRLRKGSPTRSSDAMSGYLQALADELRAVHQDRATATQAVASADLSPLGRALLAHAAADDRGGEPNACRSLPRAARF